MPAYLLSSLIPVGWVLADLLFLSRRFNFITAFLGLNSIVRGLLYPQTLQGIVAPCL